jgi:hypothetical protein
VHTYCPCAQGARRKETEKEPLNPGQRAEGAAKKSETVKELTRRGVAQRTAITTMGGLAGSLMISSPSFLSYVTPSGRATGCSAIQNRVPAGSEHTKQCLRTSARTPARISRRAHELDQDSAAHYSHHARQVRCAPENGAGGRPVRHALCRWNACHERTKKTRPSKVNPPNKEHKSACTLCSKLKKLRRFAPGGAGSCPKREHDTEKKP